MTSVPVFQNYGNIFVYIQVLVSYCSEYQYFCTSTAGTKWGLNMLYAYVIECMALPTLAPLDDHAIHQSLLIPTNRAMFRASIDLIYK